MQIECKFSADFQCFRVNDFQNNKYPQKHHNLNNSNFALVELLKILQRWHLGDYLTT